MRILQAGVLEWVAMPFSRGSSRSRARIRGLYNRIVKNIDLFKKSGDTRGTLHAKMGTIKDRKVKDLTEAEEIKRRWKEYIEELD